MRFTLKFTLLVVFVGIMAGCAAGRSAFRNGESLEEEGNLDAAVLKYAEATVANPESGEYRMRFLKVREKAADQHMKRGVELVDDKDYDGALREFEVAISLNPTLESAKQQADVVRKLRDSKLLAKEGADFEKSGKTREAYRSYKQALQLNPQNQQAAEGVERILKSKRPKMDGYELNIKSNKPITLKFRDTRLKDVFNILSQLSGINFIYDEGIKDQNLSIYLENATFQQALDVLTNMTKLGRKVLNENTIILYPKTPDKAKQYEELIVRTFFLNNLDAKKAINLLRTMLQLKKVYVNEDLNAIVVRDTPDVVDVAQKILEANDIPDAEVLLEVEVIEFSSSDVKNFGLSLSSYAVSGAIAKNNTLLSDSLSVPVTGSTSTTKPAEPTNLLKVFTSGDFSGFITVPSATYNFGKTMANGETLSNPKLRVKNREKAKFTVGTRLPITTTSSNGTTGGVNVNVQYVDVGVKLNAEPTIQVNNDVTIKISLEVSSELRRETIGGSDSATVVSTIGSRNLDTVLSLKDGETSIIGGLLQNNKSKNARKILILGDIPIIGPLFSGYNTSKDKTELVLAITPRIVRALAVPEPDLETFWSGREDEPSAAVPMVAIEPEFPETGAVTTPPASSSPTVEQSEQGGEVAPSQRVQPAPAPPANGGATPNSTQAPPVSEPAPQIMGRQVQEQQQPAAAPGGNSSGRTEVSISAPAAVKVGDTFQVEVGASVQNLSTAPFTLVYDPTFVDFAGVSEGTLLKQDGTPTTFKSAANPASGQVRLVLSRDSTSGITGSGTLAVFQFRGKNAGPAAFGISGSGFTGPGGAKIDFSPPNRVVEIR